MACFKKCKYNIKLVRHNVSITFDSQSLAHSFLKSFTQPERKRTGEAIPRIYTKIKL